MDAREAMAEQIESALTKSPPPARSGILDGLLPAAHDHPGGHTYDAYCAWCRPDRTEARTALVRAVIGAIDPDDFPPTHNAYERACAALRHAKDKAQLVAQAAASPQLSDSQVRALAAALLTAPASQENVRLSAGATVEWGVQTEDDPVPVHYAGRERERGRLDGGEAYHRKYAARHDGLLYRRTVIVSPWEHVPFDIGF